MPHVQATSLQNALATLDLAARRILTDFDTRAPLPRMFAALERTLHALARWFADTIFASFLFSLIEHTDLEARVLDAKKAHSPAWKPTRRRNVILTLLGGHLVDKKGRKKRNGYRDFDAPWIEPRQLVIYAIDSDGKPCKEFGKLAYASLDEPDALFETMGLWFRALQLEHAEQVIVVADGQHWQWERMRQLLAKVGVSDGKVLEVLDKSHAKGAPL